MIASIARHVGIMVTLAALLLATSSCSRRTQLQVFAYAVRTAVAEFQDQRSDVVHAFAEAGEAKKKATFQVQMKFSDERTQEFIDRWEEAEEEVRDLRKEFNTVIEKGDYFFAYCEKKLATIGNTDIRTRAATAIEEKKAAFSAAAVKTSGVIDHLEATIKHGNDVISGLEIAGVLNSLGDEITALGQLNDRALQKLPELDDLIKEGEGLMEVEFGALGV